MRGSVDVGSTFLCLLLVILFGGLLALVICIPIFACVWDEYYLVDPTEAELEDLYSLEDSKLVRGVVPGDVENHYIEGRKHCLVQFSLNTRHYWDDNSRRTMEKRGINYYRSEKDALGSLGYTWVDDVLKKCEE